MLNRKNYFIREHVGLLKLTDAYDILDPDTQVKIGEAREEISGLAQAMRLLVNKSLLPTKIMVYQGSEENSLQLLFTLSRGFTFFRAKIEIADASGKSLGYLQRKMLSLGGAFLVFSADNEQVAMVKGDWKGWNFRFLSGEQELGAVTKKWAGLGKELFTSADSYMISINGEPNPTINVLLLAAGLAIDTVFKENK